MEKCLTKKRPLVKCVQIIKGEENVAPCYFHGVGGMRRITIDNAGGKNE